MSILDISLTAGMRGNLLALKNNSVKIDRTQERLATGKNVNSALDNPTNFFASQAALNRASDLNNFKDGIKEAIQVIKTADIGMVAMTSIFKQASAIADSAKQASSLSALGQLAEQFNNMRKQVDDLSADSSYRGTDLLRRQDLTVALGSNSTLTIQGSDATSSGFDNMTNGLNVETASMDPLNIVDPNTVTTSTGNIKQDGQLTISNNNVPNIDSWLGATGVKFQAIISQDTSITTSPALSDGRIIQSQITDNIGVAEYGTSGFQVYRDTSVVETTGTGFTAGTYLLDTNAASQYIGSLQSSGSKAWMTLEKSPGIIFANVPHGVNGSLTPPPTINNSAVVTQFLDTPSAYSLPSFVFDSATQQWSQNFPSGPPINLIQNGTPPTSLGLDLDGSGNPAVTINLSGSWSNNDQIQIGLSNWTSSDPNVKVLGYAGSGYLTGNMQTGLIDHNGLSIFVGGANPTSFQLNLTTDELNIPNGTILKLSVNVSAWKTTDPSIILNQPTGTGSMTADLNSDGKNDIQLQLPTDGINGAKWLSTETINVATTGPFRTTDPSVTLKYNDSAKTIGMRLNGNTGSPDITINLSSNWAVNNLATSALGNGDSINLTVDGRHRWAKSDGSPNTGGMDLSLQEIDDAINTLRMNSVKNSSGLSILNARNEFISNIANVLITGADNLTLADMNQEGANMLMLQTRQSLSVTSLSLASQASQSVMKLF